jgi:hypothetical protein
MVRVWTGAALLLLPAALAAFEPLPRVREAPWPQVRERCRLLLGLLQKEKAAPPDVERKLGRLLDGDAIPEDEALEQLQDLLDPLCLAGAHINPESRVKVARGPAETGLTRDRPRYLLVKVHNEGGITAPLVVSGEELFAPGKDRDGRWLDAVLLAPGKGTLGGTRLEYIILKLTPRQSGKREATLRFDAGQGTQDLGFRAELSILFRVVPG